MSIYTRTGDKGETGLFGGSRVSKNHPRVSAYGSLDELNCHLGAARSHLPDDVALKDFDQALARIQNECFVIGTLLATPADKLASLQPPFSLGLPPQSHARVGER
jgi:cob(I)alamin adenosyltransferase